MAHFHVNKTHMLIFVLSQLIKNQRANKRLFTAFNWVQTGGPERIHRSEIVDPH